MTGSYTAPPELLALLRRHEGWSLRPYTDTKGLLTIGCGHNLAVPISDRAVQAILEDDVAAIAHQVAGDIGDDYWSTLAPARQAALIDVGFAGPAKLALFVKMLAAVRSQDWQRAHDELLNSAWAVEVKQARASCDADMLLTGEFPST